MVVRFVTVQSRCLKRVEKFIFKAGAFDLGNLCVAYVNDIPRVVKAISFEKRKIQSYPKGISEAVFRKLDKKDKNHLRKVESEEKKIKYIVSDKVKKYNYPIRIFFTEYSFDMRKIYIYFSSEEHLELFILVKKISEILNVNVEFRQISRREVARFVGGIGVCGRNICCKSFLIDLKRISASSASSQDLMTDSPKFAGLCGCLMCCLSYEESMYYREKKNMPSIDEVVNTPKGVGVVTGVNVISQTIKVSLMESSNSSSLFFNISEISRIVE